jgi:hypothetical protein
VISVRKSIFENPVLFDSVLACRNKSRVGQLVLIKLDLALGWGFGSRAGSSQTSCDSAFVNI